MQDFVVIFFIITINNARKKSKLGFQFKLNYFWRVIFNTLSLLCSLAGGECLDFLLRLILAILSSPKTSPVLKAEIKSSNSALSPVLPLMDT